MVLPALRDGFAGFGQGNSPRDWIARKWLAARRIVSDLDGRATVTKNDGLGLVNRLPGDRPDRSSPAWWLCGVPRLRRSPSCSSVSMISARMVTSATVKKVFSNCSNLR